MRFESNLYPDFLCDPRERGQPWPQTTFEITLKLLPNLVVDVISVTCHLPETLIDPPEEYTVNYPVAPFDALRPVILSQIIEAAIGAVERRAGSDW